MTNSHTQSSSYSLAALGATLALAASAAPIDFERINMAVPHEGLVISNQFEPYYGVRFRRTSAGKPWPVIARAGAPQIAFDRNGSAAGDTPADAYTNRLQTFFLTDTVGDQGGSASEYLIVEYGRAVARASGYIIDIDHEESVSVRAYSDLNGVNLLTNVTLAAGQANTGDGVGTFWQFTRSANDIRRIEIRNNGAYVGYDLFDSDYAAVTPPPRLGLRLYPGINIQGVVGRRYQIDYADRLDIAPGTTNWRVLTTNLFLPATNFLFTDTNAAGPERYYRALALP
jgi:hypothetical protein